MMKCGFNVFLLVLLCSLSLPFANAENEYLIDADYDPIILDCAIAFLVLCIIFLILIIIVWIAVYYKIKNTKGIEKNYQVSYREGESTTERSGPFHGHAMYSRRTTPTNSIYLPGHNGNAVERATSKYGQPPDYDGSAVYQDSSVTRDYPPTEKGQRDAMTSEKNVSSYTKERRSGAFENTAYAEGVTSFNRESQHTYATITTTKVEHKRN